MKERWFGATGRRVPELAAEGEIDTADALVLDDVADDARLRDAFDAGTPIVVRASTLEQIKVVLARTEVASGCSKMVRTSVETHGWAVLGTRVSRLRW